MLLIERMDEVRFYCRTCPYVYQVQSKVKQIKFLEGKAVDDIMGGEDAWKDVDQIEEVCPRCENNKAYFMMIQIRGGDEPATKFFKCTKCKYNWRVD